MEESFHNLVPFTSPRADKHRDHILRKLHALDSAIRTRTGIAVWIVKKYHGLLSVMLTALGEVGGFIEPALPGFW